MVPFFKLKKICINVSNIDHELFSLFLYFPQILDDLYVSSVNGYGVPNNWTAYVINEDENELSSGFKVALSRYCENSKQTELWMEPCEDDKILRLIISDITIVDQDRIIRKLRSYEVDSAEVESIAPSGWSGAS